MAFDARVRIDRWSGEAVRRSYKTIDLSVAQDARMDVSVWLNETPVMVSTEVGHAKVCVGVEEGREKS